MGAEIGCNPFEFLVGLQDRPFAVKFAGFLLKTIAAQEIIPAVQAKKRPYAGQPLAGPQG
jgi:hypothetical protein